MSSLQPSPADTSSQRWAWWPLLPLYPYGRRPTLMRELVPKVRFLSQLLQREFIYKPRQNEEPEVRRCLFRRLQ